MDPFPPPGPYAYGFNAPAPAGLREEGAPPLVAGYAIRERTLYARLGRAEDG